MPSTKPYECFLCGERWAAQDARETLAGFVCIYCRPDLAGQTVPEAEGIEHVTHRCHARRCRTQIPERYLMCQKHWAMVPAPLRQAVWRHYRPGQEHDKRPSEAWFNAAKVAIRAVALAEARQLELF